MNTEKKIKDWYHEKYPTDSIYKDIDRKLTFEDAFNDLKAGEFAYKSIGVNESIVRERVMDELANQLSEDAGIYKSCAAKVIRTSYDKSPDGLSNVTINMLHPDLSVSKARNLMRDEAKLEVFGLVKNSLMIYNDEDILENDKISPVGEFVLLHEDEKHIIHFKNDKFFYLDADGDLDYHHEVNAFVIGHNDALKEMLKIECKNYMENLENELEIKEEIDIER